MNIRIIVHLRSSKSDQEFKPLLSGKFVLEKFPGKGGWTYARLPWVSPDRSQPFGWRIVSGSIDEHPLVHYKLMPMGDGSLFLPVKASIRKKIQKEAGDWVQVVLYEVEPPHSLCAELMECLAMFPGSKEMFESLPEAEQKGMVMKVFYAANEDEKAALISGLIDKLLTLREDSGK